MEEKNEKSYRCESCGAIHYHLTSTLESQLVGLLARLDHMEKEWSLLKQNFEEAIEFLHEKPPEEKAAEAPKPIEVSTVPENKEAAKTETPPPQKQKR